jgi:hypothetical protein
MKQEHKDRIAAEPAPPDAGIVPGGIRDRALRAMGYAVPSCWYRRPSQVRADENDRIVLLKMEARDG